MKAVLRRGGGRVDFDGDESEGPSWFKGASVP
jgi:hypothetical protein